MVLLSDRPLGETSSLPRWALLDRCDNAAGHGSAKLAVAEGRVRLARRPQEQEQGGEGEEVFCRPFRRIFGAHFDRLCARVSALDSWECVWPRPNNVSR